MEAIGMLLQVGVVGVAVGIAVGLARLGGRAGAILTASAPARMDREERWER